MNPRLLVAMFDSMDISGNAESYMVDRPLVRISMFYQEMFAQ